MEITKQWGLVDFQHLNELWFHTGTDCNLKCVECFEHSEPGNQRIEKISLHEVRDYMQQAVSLGVSQFSFTGGEPFMNKNFLEILDYAIDLIPCMVLTNGTKPLQSNFEKLSAFSNRKNPLSFRISLDSFNSLKHDQIRGKGNFDLALTSIQKLIEMGFSVSVARRKSLGENKDEIESSYRTLFVNNGIPAELRIVSFPNLEKIDITDECIQRTKSAIKSITPMCAFSRMIVKQNGRICIYACTLVDDDPLYDFGDSLENSLQVKTPLLHKRCFTCYTGGMSCSELGK